MKKVNFDSNCNNGMGPILMEWEVEELKLYPNEAVIAIMENEEWDAVIRYDIKNLNGYYKTPWYLEVDNNSHRCHPGENSKVHILYEGKLFYGIAKYSKECNWYVLVDEKFADQFSNNDEKAYVIDDICLWDGIVNLYQNSSVQNQFQLKFTKRYHKMAPLRNGKVFTTFGDTEWVRNILCFDGEVSKISPYTGMEVTILEYFCAWNGNVIKNQVPKESELGICISFDTYSYRSISSTNKCDPDKFLFDWYKENIINLKRDNKLSNFFKLT